MEDAAVCRLEPTEMLESRGRQTPRQLPLIAKSDLEATAIPACELKVHSDAHQAIFRHSNGEIGETKFREGVIDILDESKSNTRSNGLWAKLHKHFFAPFLADLNKGRPNSLEAQARRMTTVQLLEEEHPTSQMLIKHAADAYDNHTAYNAARIKLMGYHPKFHLRLWAAVFQENLIFLQLEKTQGAARSMVSTPEPLDLEFLPEEYHRRFQATLVHARLVDRDLYLPQMLPEQLNVNQRSPLDLKPIWACRQLGMEPSLRSFPELASVIMDIRAVTYLTPGKHAPPALLLHFTNPLYDVVPGRGYEHLAVALLKEPLPVQACRDEDENTYIIANEQDIRSLVFKENSASTKKIKILGQLIELAIAEKLLPRVGYSYYGREGIPRYASLVGRTEQENKAVLQTVRAYLDLELARLKDGLSLGRKPKTHAFRKELERKLQHWRKMAPVLSAFGMPEAFANQQIKQRIQMLAARKELLGIARDEHFGPSARIFVSSISTDEGDRFVVHANDAKRLAQRMNNAAAKLMSARTLVNKLKDSFKDDKDRAVFLYLLNLSVFMDLPTNPKKPFIRTLAREIEAALCEQYSSGGQREIQDFLSQIRMELRVAIPPIQLSQRETLASGIQDIYYWFRFIRYYQQGHHDEALKLSSHFSSELHSILDHLLKPIIEAKVQEKMDIAKTLVLQIRKAAKAARNPSARKALLPRTHDAKQSLESFPELARQINGIENQILPPRMKAAREILEDPSFTQDLSDSRSQLLRHFLTTISQGRHFDKEDKVRRHVEAKVKREPHIGGVHARILIHLFPENGSKHSAIVRRQ
jgi:hypothetical protein